MSTVEWVEIIEPRTKVNIVLALENTRVDGSEVFTNYFGFLKGLSHVKYTVYSMFIFQNEIQIK